MNQYYTPSHLNPLRFTFTDDREEVAINSVVIRELNTTSIDFVCLMN